MASDNLDIDLFVFLVPYQDNSMLNKLYQFIKKTLNSVINYIKTIKTLSRMITLEIH